MVNIDSQSTNDSVDLWTGIRQSKSVGCRSRPFEADWRADEQQQLEQLIWIAKQDQDSSEQRQFDGRRGVGVRRYSSGSAVDGQRPRHRQDQRGRSQPHLQLQPSRSGHAAATPPRRVAVRGPVQLPHPGRLCRSFPLVHAARAQGPPRSLRPATGNRRLSPE